MFSSLYGRRVTFSAVPCKSYEIPPGNDGDEFRTTQDPVGSETKVTYRSHVHQSLTFRDISVMEVMCYEGRELAVSPEVARNFLVEKKNYRLLLAAVQADRSPALPEYQL